MGHLTISLALWLHLLQALQIRVYLALDLAIPSLRGIGASDYLLLLAREVCLRIVKKTIDVCQNLLREGSLVLLLDGCDLRLELSGGPLKVLLNTHDLLILHSSILTSQESFLWDVAALFFSIYISHQLVLLRQQLQVFVLQLHFEFQSLEFSQGIFLLVLAEVIL